MADAYFARFREANLRVEVAVRPQQFRRNIFKAQQEEVADPANQLIKKIGYARQRWGATLFYIDSNGYPGWPLSANIIAKVARTFPDVLLIPEYKNVSYYAISAPYSELRRGVSSTPGLLRFLYPQAFSVVNTADASVEKRYSELLAAANRGDILMFRSRFADSANVILKQIYMQSDFKGQ